LPIDLSRLLIKRRSKESSEFVMAYLQNDDATYSVYTELEKAEPISLMRKATQLNVHNHFKQSNEINEYLRK
jgi:hypothetical protein